MSGIAFQNVAGLNPGRTRFDWHTSKKFDTEMGILYPIFVKKCIPGDYWKINSDILVRCTPLAAPIMHEVSIDTHYFFVPERILDDEVSIPGCGNTKGDPIMLKGAQPPANRFNWELFITGGFNGLDTQTTPKWNPDTSWDGIDLIGDTPQQHSAIVKSSLPNEPHWNGQYATKFNLWDAMGLPILNSDPDVGTLWSSPILPVDAPRRAYNFIWNMYYRDETLQNPVPWNNMHLLKRAWRKDYFTSCLPFQQRGDAPAFPVTLDGVLNASFNLPAAQQMNTSNATPFGFPLSIGSDLVSSLTAYSQIGASSNSVREATQNMLNQNTITVGQINTASFDVADLRNIVQLQKYLERNARAGVRLNEFIKAHFGVNLNDGRLSRPEYIGGTKQPLIISEVIQTSETSSNSPQGNMAGHGISANGEYVGDYTCPEHGWIIGLMSIMPTPSYQQGINRTWLTDTKLDFFTPEFVNLSEQGVKQAEIYIANNSTDEMLFGYQGMYDEYRTQNSEVTGNFRDTLDYWHLGRKFANAPKLNGEFIVVEPKETRRIFLDQTEPGLLVDIEHYFTAVRPMPEIAEPGLLDHH